jgi:hypothetical protein
MRDGWTMGVATYAEPNSGMGVGRIAGAARVLVGATGLDQNRVIHRACITLSTEFSS